MEEGMATGGAADGGSYAREPWDDAGVARCSATGSDAESAVLAGLRAVLATLSGDDAPATVSADQASIAAPIRGQGGDLGAVFAELVNDLLSQVDANGPGLTEARLDGLLETDDGGYTAWGYALGAASAAPPPLAVSLSDAPEVERDADRLTLRFALRRDGS